MTDGEYLRPIFDQVLMESMSRRRIAIAASILLLPVLAVLDLVTGYEINFFVFYFVPVALLAWFGNRSAAVAMAIGCAVVWYWVDVRSGHTYAVPVIGVWNAALRLTSFLMIAVLVSKVRVNQEQQAQLNHKLQATVAELEQSLEHVRRLQSELQVVCAWTNRIRHDGKWMRFEEFLKSNLQLRFSHGISEEAVAEIRKQLDDSTTP